MSPDSVLSEKIILDAFDDFFIPGRPYLDEIIINVVADENTAILGLEAGELQFAGYAISGHSFGGYTTLATAGAPVDLDAAMAYCDMPAEKARVVSENCINCKMCLKACFADAMQDGETHTRVNTGNCVGCGGCYSVCPAEGAIAIEVVSESETSEKKRISNIE